MILIHIIYKPRLWKTSHSVSITKELTLQSVRLSVLFENVRHIGSLFSIGWCHCALVSGPNPSSACTHSNPYCNLQTSALQVDDLMIIRALTAVFGMQNNWKIKKYMARRVVEMFGMMKAVRAEKSSFDLPGGLEDEVSVEEVPSGLEDRSNHRHLLLYEAFKVFDEDGNRYIEAAEMKRVLHCLGLDKGWEMKQIEKILKADDLNFEGK